MTEEKYIFRTKVEKEYTVIRNSLILDKNISWEARGLLIYLLSKPETWIVRKVDLVAMSPASEYLTTNILREVESAGYIERKKKQNKKGQWEWHTWVYDQPIPQNMGGGETIPQNTIHGKTIHGKVGYIVSTELTNTEKEKKKGNNNNIITKSLKKKILAMGWTGSLEEIIKLYNEDPDYVKDWIEIIDKVDLYPRAGLLRKSLRSGEKPPTETDKRNRYLEDPLAGFLED